MFYKMKAEQSHRAWEFWRKFGEKPICLAPMAEVNDLAFRILCRNHGIRVCYTGMINAIQWCQGKRYQTRVFNTSCEDRPLIVQLAGSNHDSLLAAAKDISQYCDAIDINLGCTQHIAKRGGYGFFMVDTEEKRDSVIELFKKLVKEVPIPITAKIRVFTDSEGNSDENLTVNFAKRLQAAGVYIVEVHGRFQMRNKKADVATSIIKRAVDELDIPVVANGGVLSKEDADKLFELTGSAGVMVGQALLSDPTIFDKEKHSLKEFSTEYLQIAMKFPDINFFCPRKHIFTFFTDMIKQKPGIEKEIQESETYDDLLNFVNKYT